jgi:hypothetical protein
MKDDLLTVFSVLRFIYSHSRIKINRSNSDFLADKIVYSSTEPNVLAFVERLSKLMDSDIASIWESRGVEFLKVSGTSNASTIYQWIRKYPRIVAMLCVLPQQSQVVEALETIKIDSLQENGKALPQGSFEVPITITTLSPLAHGGDSKAGNATLFRRMQVLSDTGSTLSLPFYSGNALRGQMRDLLADDFLKALDIKPSKTNPPITLWFFHTLYAGGALEENSEASKAFGKFLGANGAIKAEGIYQFRDTLPMISALGCSLGNRIIEGRANFGDFRPDCFEWSSGDIKASELMTWEFLTRREDFEGHEDGENSSMIANTECLKSGVILRGGIDIRGHASDMERSVIGKGLSLLSDRGFIGADSRRGFGKVKMDVKNIPDKTLYEKYLSENKPMIKEYLISLGARCTPLL